MSIGTKTVFWPLVLTNAGTLVCLVSGRANPIASSLGLALAVFGLVLLLRYTLARRRRGDVSDTEVT